MDAQTSKFFIDSLLNSKGNTKIEKDRFVINPTTGKKAIIKTDFYKNLGLFFRRYENNLSRLTIGIKFHKAADYMYEFNYELRAKFSGELYIGDNFMNDKKTLSQLKDLKNCTLIVDNTSYGWNSTWGDIIYEQNSIRVTFDKKTKELLTLFIYHTFKER